MLQLSAMECSRNLLTPQRSSTNSAQIPLVPLLSKIPTRRRTESDSIDDEDESYNNPSEPVETFQRAAFYGRFSSSKQNEDSIDIQLDICRQRAESEGYSIPSELQFSDEGVSGALPCRDGLDQLKLLARNGGIQRLYVRSLSRLSRDMLFNLQDFIWFKSRDVVIISIDDGIDSRLPNSEITAFMTGWKNEQYLKDLATFVFHGQANSVRRGNSVGDHCYGYRSVVKSDEQRAISRNGKPVKIYEIDEEQAEVVRQIFEWYGGKEQKSLSWIARKLNETKAPLGTRRRSGRWREDLVRTILNNPKYIGVWFWGKKQNFRDPDTKKIRQKQRSDEELVQLRRDFPDMRIIEEEAWELVHQRFHVQHLKWKKYRKSDGRLSGSPPGSQKRRSRRMLAGTVFCKHCGSQLRVGGSNSEYLICPNPSNGTCQNRTQLKIELAERLLLSEIQKRILGNPEWVLMIHEAVTAAWEQQQQEQPHTIGQIEADLVKLQQKINNLLNQIEESGDSSKGLLDRLKKREAEKERLQVRLKMAKRSSRKSSPPPSPEAIAEDLQNLWQTLSCRGSDAALPLRRLVGGKIEAERIDRGGKKRDFIRLHVRLDIAACSSASEPSTLTVPSGASPSEADAKHAPGEAFSIDCRVPPSLNKLQTR